MPVLANRRLRKFGGETTKGEEWKQKRKGNKSMVSRNRAEEERTDMGNGVLRPYDSVGTPERTLRGMMESRSYTFVQYDSARSGLHGRLSEAVMALGNTR